MLVEPLDHVTWVPYEFYAWHVKLLDNRCNIGLRLILWDFLHFCEDVCSRRIRYLCDWLICFCSLCNLLLSRVVSWWVGLCLIWPLPPPRNLLWICNVLESKLYDSVPCTLSQATLWNILGEDFALSFWNHWPFTLLVRSISWLSNHSWDLWESSW